jgi:hypothetical protein
VISGAGAVKAGRRPPVGLSLDGAHSGITMVTELRQELVVAYGCSLFEVTLPSRLDPERPQLITGQPPSSRFGFSADCSCVHRLRQSSLLPHYGCCSTMGFQDANRERSLSELSGNLNNHLGRLSSRGRASPSAAIRST